MRKTRLVTQNHGTIELNALLDSGADVNLVNQRLVIQYDLARSTVPKPKAHTVGGQDLTIFGNNDLVFQMDDDAGTSREFGDVFAGAVFGPYDIILGMPWLSENDPEISFRRKALRWRDEDAPHIAIITAEEFLEELGVGRSAYVMLPIGLTSDPADPVPTSSLQVSDVSAEATLHEYYSEYAHLGSEEQADTLPNHSEYDHAIDLLPGTVPPHRPIYNMSQTELKTLREYIDTTLQKGWIRESKSQAGAPVLFVPKKDGKLRLCVDYRGLNKITVKNRYPLPLISELLDRVSGAKRFTKLDLRAAYNHIRIRAGDEWKTAFRTRYGHYEYLVMPFGLANAPATFQSYINRALGSLIDTICVVYLDDILIFSKDDASHQHHVRMVLEKLDQASLFLQLEKCRFHVTSVDFLGFILTPDGVHMDPERVATIQEWPEPQGYRDILVFLGFANFYRRFIDRYSQMAAPMYQLLAGFQRDPKKSFEWPDAAATSFRRLVGAFSTAPLLRHFNPALPIRLVTDASGFALAGILLQLHQIPDGVKPTEYLSDEHDADSEPAELQLGRRGHWLPVAFYSRKFTAVEGRYDTHDKELLAIFASFKHWRHYVAGATFEVQVLSDHNNLRYFMSTKELTARQARWAEYLSAFDFGVFHLAGVKNPADGLSRRPDYERDSLQREGIGLMLPTLQHKLRIREGNPSTSLARTGEGATSIDHAQSNGWEVASVRLCDAPTPLRSRGDVGELQGLGVLVSRWDVAAVAATETAWEETPTLLMNFIKAVQDAATSERHWQNAGAQSVTDWQRDVDGLWRYEGRIWIPKCRALVEELLSRNHDDPAGGHCGYTRTLEVLKRKYWWATMAKDTKDYLNTCAVCGRSKAKRHRPYGELVPLEPPTEPLKDFSLDFITGLPPSKTIQGRVIDAVLVIVDRFSKLVAYVGCTKDIDAPAMAELVFQYVVLKYGVPNSFVSDRGSVFTSEYWSTLCYHLRVKRRLSTAFHPQTDGQTERMNQELELFLRVFCSWDQSNWAVLLADAEFAYNSKRHSTIRVSPIEAAHGIVPAMPDGLRAEVDPHRQHRDAEARLVRLRADHARISENIRIAQESQAKYYNKSHKALMLSVGDYVLLSARHIRMAQPSKKLSAKYLGPFRVAELVGKNAYRLDLPYAMRRVHNVFHISLLEPCRRRDGVEPPPVQEGDVEEEAEWEIECIVAHKREHGRLLYRVRWLGWSPEYDEWMPEERLENAKSLLATYRMNVREHVAELPGLRRSKRKRKGRASAADVLL